MGCDEMDAEGTLELGISRRVEGRLMVVSDSVRSAGVTGYFLQVHCVLPFGEGHFSESNEIWPAKA